MDPWQLQAALDSCPWQVTSVVSGGARGVDRMGELYAQIHRLPCDVCAANWNLYGKSAGYKRNVEMANNAEALIALWDGVSRGTGHMINIARAKGLKVHVHTV